MRAILTWHSVDESDSPISVRPEVFRRQVEFLGSGRVRVVPLAALAAATDDGEDAVALTFDDGFANVGAIALPELAAQRLPATVFVVPEHVGGRNDWGGHTTRGIPTLPLMDWRALGVARDAGFEIGAHTRRHRDLAAIGGAALEDEVAGCVERMDAELGERPSSFAYPYGRTSPEAITVVRDVYARAVTTEFRLLRGTEDHALLPRIDMYYFRSPGQLESWGNASFMRRLWIRAQGRRVRRLVAGDGVSM
ncbi:MAG: hypothetical protein MNPFHGCM_02109 [Gemmatimonadaceae bacterium]|nr:hypothetical protein [Gemmatimonadaceae bacterium]